MARTVDRMDVDEEEENKSNENDDGDDGDNEDEEEDDDSSDDDDFFFKWIDNGRRHNGRREYNSVLLTMHGTSFKVTKGDFVLLWGLHGDEKEAKQENDDIMNQTIEEIWQSAGCAKVEAMWEAPPSSRGGEPKPMFDARWFFQVCLLYKLMFDSVHLSVS